MGVMLLVVGLAGVGCDRSSVKKSEPVEPAKEQKSADEQEADAESEGAAEAPEKKSDEGEDLPFKRCGATAEIAPADSKNNKAFKAFATKARELGEKKRTEHDRAMWLVEAEHREICRKWLGAEKLSQDQVDRNGGSCEVEFQRDGRVAVISRIVGCGGDDCTAEHYVWPGTQPKPTKVPETTDRSEVEVAADLKTLVWDKGFTMGQADARVPRLLLRGSVGTDEPCALATCFAPRLTPNGKQILCRTSDGFVHAIGVNAAYGEAEKVAGADDVPGKIEVRLQWGVFPTAVRFTGARTFEYDIVKRVETEEGDERKEVTKTGEWSAK
jgi:hypothetical protein